METTNETANAVTNTITHSTPLSVFKVTIHYPAHEDRPETTHTHRVFAESKEHASTRFGQYGGNVLSVDAIKPNAKETDRLEAINELRALLVPGQTVYTMLRHVSSSGMYRAIDVFVMRDNEPWRLTWTVSRACAIKYDRKHEALGVGGCGMDMGFHVVYELASALWPSGFECVRVTSGDASARCPSNDHANRDKSTWHKSGGYALNQRWL